MHIQTGTATDVYRTITDAIIAAIEQGAGEFVMPWHGGNISRPQNAFTENDYHGVGTSGWR